MARSQQSGTVLEQPKPVSVDELLAHRPRTPHLFDIAAHMDPLAFPDEAGADPGAAGRGSVGSTLYELVRGQGDRQTDIRLLVDGGARHVGVARELARSLRCDVYLSAENAEVRCLHEVNPVGGDLWDAVAVDQVTGEPSDWLVVRPPELAAEVPTWFISTRGRLRQSSGLVSVQIPGGLAFATKSTFRDTAFLATRMKPGTIRVTTIAVTVEHGRFAISRFDDAGALLGGVEFATLIAASVDMIHPDVQLALTWPTDEAACEALDVELMRVADGLNRTVWVPQPQGAAFVLPGCGEFAAVDEVGGPSAWRAYPSRLAGEWRPRYGTDLDGRLVPLGDVAGASFPGVPFVSVPLGQLEYLRAWYESVGRWDGLFAMDLAVLGDGRLGVLLHGGHAIAVAPRELRVLLRDAGWQGQDLLLLTQPPANLWHASVEHLQSLVDVLAVDVWMPARGAQVWAKPDGCLAADGPEGAWHVVTYGRGERKVDDAALPDGLARAPRPPGQYAPLPSTSVAAAVSDVTVLIPSAYPNLGGRDAGSPAGGEQPAAGAQPSELPAGAEMAGAEMAGAETVGAETVGAETVGAETVGAEQPAREPAGLERVTVGLDAPHGIEWLPAEAAVNYHPTDLYLWTPDPVEEVHSSGMPSADAFLLAGQDPLRLAERRRDGHLLRVHAPEHTAVDLREHAADTPAAVRDLLAETGATHLLALPWLGELRVTARFDLDGRGGVAARHDIDPGTLAIRFEGAGHGVPGLPNDVVRWPRKDRRADAPCYLMLPESTALDRQLLRGGYLALARKKPALADGHVLMEIKVRKRRAIDVPATVAALGGLRVIGRLQDFVGLDLLVAEQDLGQAMLTRCWQPGPTGKPVVTRFTGETLLQALEGAAR